MQNRRGQSLVELLIAFGLAGIFLPAVLTGLVSSREGKAQESKRLQAVALLREEEEAVRSVRESGWINIASNGTFHATTSGTTWILTPGAEQTNGFSRQIVISDTYRDSSGAIVQSGGSVDPSTKKLDSSVSWNFPLAKNVSSTLYLTRYLDSMSWQQTTQSDFNQGTKTSIKVQTTNGSTLPDDGEMVLSQTGGYGDWCTPSLTFAAVDLPKSGVANAISAIPGQIAAGTGDNSSGVSFANVTVSDPSSPTAPVATITGTFDGYKTNEVFTESNYAYLGSDNNGKEVVIVNLGNKDSNGKYAEAGYFNAPGNGSGDTLAVSNNVGYMTSGNKLYAFDLSSKSGSRPVLGSTTLAGGAVRLVIVGTKAYVATNSTSAQLQIVNIATPSALPAPTTISVNGLAARDVFVNQTQTRAYLATANSGSKSEFFVIDLTNTSVRGNYDTGSMDPRGVVAVSGARAIVVGIGGTEYQVIDITNDGLSPLPGCGGLNIDSGINRVATVFTPAQRAYSYIITRDANAELKIIEGGPGAGGGQYAPTGTYTSVAFGPTSQDSAFNRFGATINQPSLNDVQMQIGVADALLGSCVGANYTFVGTDGSGSGSSHFFSTNTLGVSTLSGIISLGSFAPSYKNPGKCLKYKVFLNTTDPTLTPVVKDVTVNYSP